MNVTINDKEYRVPELDFNAICDLEEKGINLLGMGEGDVKIASMLRGLVAWIMDTDQKTAANEIQEHIANGGNIGDIMTAINAAIEDSGFFSQNRGRKAPMDHQKKSSGRSTRA